MDGNKVVIKKLFALAVSLVLFGCATAPPATINTSTGRPEVTIVGVTKKQVYDAIVLSATERGTTVKSVSEYGVTLAKPIEGIAAALLFGSRYDSTPEGRITLTVVDIPDGVRVFGRSEVITNPGSAFEKKTDITDNSRVEIQNSLERLKAKFVQPALATTITTPAPGSIVNSKNDPVITPKNSIGQDSYQVIGLAKSFKCTQNPAPVLTSKGPGFEIYSVACENGDTWSVRCEYGNCRNLR